MEASELEQLVDRVGLAEVLRLLEVVCAGKADHVRANWQDSGLARLWERAGKRLDVCQTAVAKIGLP